MSVVIPRSSPQRPAPVRSAAIDGGRRRPANRGTLPWDLLLVCTAGYILTSVGRVHQLFPGLQPLRPALLTGVLAIALYLIDRREPRRVHHLVVPTSKYLVGFLIWMIVSVPVALWVGNSFDLVFTNFIKTLVMYFVLAGAVRAVRDVERLAFVYLLAAALYGVVVVYQFQLGADAWRLGDLYYYDANDFATLAVSAMPLALYFLHAGRSPVVRLVAVSGLAVLTLALVRSGSRGGFLAMVAVAGFVLLRYTGISPRWRVSGTIVVLLVLLGAATDRYWQEMSTILSKTDYNMTEESGRFQIWRRGVGYMLQYPILGVGPNNFGVAEGTLAPFAERQQFGIGVRWNAAHNSFIQVGAELGIPGLVLFVAIIGSTLRALRRSRRLVRATSRQGLQLTQALTASFIGLLVGSLFLSLAYSEMLYTLIALAIGLDKVATGLSGRRPATIHRP